MSAAFISMMNRNSTSAIENSACCCSPLEYDISLATAVVRNRTRRRLKEIYRTHEAAFRSGYDIVVVARSRAVGADFALLTKNFLGCAGKLGLLKKEL